MFCSRSFLTFFKHTHSIRMSSVFIQKLNPMLGENTWELQNENYDFHQEIARSSFADMLHDTERNQKYFDALKLAIEKMHAMGKKAKVLDIGTGTGLLSMMAVQCGADTVVACESFVPMSECAKEVLKLNNCDGKVKILPKHSTHLIVGSGGDLEEKANILVTEVFDTELIGEGALKTFSHAHKELLEKDCIVIPDSAVIYAQVVETPLARNWNTFKNIYDDDGELLISAPDSIEECQGAAAVHDIQLSQLKLGDFKEIIQPTPVMHFDWSGKTNIVFNREDMVTVRAKCDGKAQVVFMWWELGMDVDNKIILSCAPYWAHPLKEGNPNLASADIPWRDHWMQALYYLPKEINVKKDEECKLISCYDKFSLWFHLVNEDLNKSKVTGEQEFAKPICQCGFHLAHSRTRIGQINDHIRNKKYISLLEKYVNKESVVLLISDGFYCGLVASKLGAKKVLYLDDNYLSTRVFKEFIKFNNLTNVEVIDSTAKLKENENLTDVTLIIGQPHFSTTILPWDSLHFAYLINKVKDVLAPNVKIAPKTAVIKGVVVEFQDLQKIRLPLESCENFNVQPFDKLILHSCNTCDANIEAQPLWEYPCIAQSNVLELAKINLETMFESTNLDFQKSFAMQSQSKYNGIALWVDWILDDDNPKGVISTGPIVPPEIGQFIHWDMHTRQGVHFLDSKNKKEICVNVNFNVKNGMFKFSFT